MPTKEEVYDNMYGEIEEQIESSTPEELEEEITGSDSTEFTTGVVEYSDESKTVSPFTTDVTGPRKTSVRKLHNNRTERAQTIDEQQNAPVTTDEEKWVENKDRYDYPGVDTIPRGRLERRADTAAKKIKDRGMVDRVEKKGSARSLQGKFSPKGNKDYGREEDVVRVQGTANQPERTLAHEVGHAVDFGTGEERGFKLTGRLFDLDTPVSEAETEELTEQAIGLSKKARGDFQGQEQYRRQYTELTADVVGQAIVQPRATKRDAPELFDRVQKEAEKEGFDDIFGNEDEPLGVL